MNGQAPVSGATTLPPLSTEAQALLDRCGEVHVVGCPKCGTLNLMTAAACEHCGLPRAPKIGGQG